MPKRYPMEFRRDVVAVARQSSDTREQIASDFGISSTTLKRWLKQADVDDGLVDGRTSVEQEELVQLRRAKRQLEQENLILKRAAAYLAKDTLPK